MKTFEKYLEEDVWEPEGVLDDDMSEAFDVWLGDLSTQEVIDYTDDYRKYICNSLKKNVQKYTDPKPEYDGMTWETIIKD